MNCTAKIYKFLNTLQYKVLKILKNLQLHGSEGECGVLKCCNEDDHAADADVCIYKVWEDPPRYPFECPFSEQQSEGKAAEADGVSAYDGIMNGSNVIMKIPKPNPVVL